MKRVLIVASVASMIEQFNMDNIEILQKKGFEVHVACNFESGNNLSNKRLDEFKVELLKKKIKFFHLPIPRNINEIKDILNSYRQLKNIVNKYNYKIVHCHSPIGGVIARLACRNMRKNGTKVIYTAHGFHFYKGAPRKNWVIFLPIEKICGKFTDCLVTINEEDYKRARNLRIVCPDNIFYVPGVGVSVNDFKIINKNAVLFKQEFQIPESYKILLSVGELTKRKNHEAGIRAFANANLKNYVYVICGIGVLRGYLEELAKELRVADKIIFTGYRTDIVQINRAADIFLFPSLQEGLPVALMEAMAAGLPVICSNIRGNNTLIADGEGGFLIDSSDIDGIADRLYKLDNNKLLCDNMSKVNQKNIKKYDKKRINNIMEKIYSSIDA